MYLREVGKDGEKEVGIQSIGVVGEADVPEERAEVGIWNYGEGLVAVGVFIPGR